jgi:NAD(P)H-hydrate epimerase
VISVDLPSGIHADTGAVLSEAVIADVTVTFALQKRGLIASPGSEHAGGVVTVDIGIPPEVIDHVAPAAFLSDDMQAPFLPARLPNSHKGTFGHVLVIGGSPGRGGATLLAGMAALRSGAGLVSVLSDARCQPALEGRYPELMVDAGWSPAAVSSEKIAAALSEKSVVIVGPGLAVDSDGWCVLEAVLKNVTCPLVLDAGALSLIAQHPDCLRELAVDYVLTPHPGEAARLLGTSSGAIQANRFDAAQQLQRLTGGVVVLKGARTLTVDQDAQLYVNQTGNVGLATAGTGDVLCGIIAAFLARGLPLADGSRAAVHVHGEAGDRVVARLGQESLIASDLLEAIPGVLNGDEPDA